MEFHLGYLLLSVFLGVLLLFIWATPSGPSCPKCESSMTEHILIRSSDPLKPREIEFRMCYICKHTWDKKDNGKLVIEFRDDPEEPTNDDETPHKD